MIQYSNILLQIQVRVGQMTVTSFTHYCLIEGIPVGRNKDANTT